MVETEQKDNLKAQLHCTIRKEDYTDQYKQELKRYQQNADLKGFRKGKVPMRVIKKRMGQGILIDVVTEQLNEELNAYLKEHSDEYIGQPLPSEDQSPQNWDVNNPQDFEFSFDIGLRPDYDLDQLLSEDTLDLQKYQVEVDEATIDEELEMARKRHGDTMHPEDEIREDDILVIQARELEGDEPKEDGWETEFSVMVDRIADDDLREQLTEESQGYTFRFNIYELEKETSEDYVDKYLLQREEDEQDVEVNPEFEGTVHQVNRIQPSEMNEEFFQEYMGDESITTEEEVRDNIREEIEEFYGMQADNLLLQHLYRELMDKAAFELPDEFLRRWLKSQREEESEEGEEVNVTDHDYEHFREEMKWYLVQSELERHYDIEIQGPELKQFIQRKVKEQLGQMYQQQGAEQLMDMVLQQVMQDEEQVRKYYNQLLTKRSLQEAAEDLKPEVQTVSIEKFKDIAKEFNEQMEARHAHHHHEHEEE